MSSNSGHIPYKAQFLSPLTHTVFFTLSLQWRTDRGCVYDRERLTFPSWGFTFLGFCMKTSAAHLKPFPQMEGGNKETQGRWEERIAGQVFELQRILTLPTLYCPLKVLKQEQWSITKHRSHHNETILGSLFFPSVEPCIFWTPSVIIWCGYHIWCGYTSQDDGVEGLKICMLHKSIHAG